MDLMVTDLVMPSMSSVRLAEQIRARWPAVKILFVSGFPTSDTLPASGSQSIPSSENRSHPIRSKPRSERCWTAEVVSGFSRTNNSVYDL
jgi:hypothetical protein